MTKIPVIFAIDDNVVMQCGVTITSLLQNASSDTFYEMTVLCTPEKLSVANRERLTSAFRDATNGVVQFLDVEDTFDSSQEFGDHITVATYYRLLIPTLFPQYDRVIYSDVDIIFQQDLSELYAVEFPNNEFLAVVRDLAINDEFFFGSQIPNAIGKTTKTYFNAGFLLMNTKALRDADIVPLFIEHAQKPYPQHDQDVLNIVCNNKVVFLPSVYNFQPSHYANYMWNRSATMIDFKNLLEKATIHYTGSHKPWNSLECVAADAWWHYFRQSQFFDNTFYFAHQYDIIESSRRDYKKTAPKVLLLNLLSRIKHFFVCK